MQDITVENIISITKGLLVIGDKSDKCINFSKDTRTINKGDTYIGIKGEKLNGNVFWKEALNNGAKTIIVEGIDFSLENISQYVNINIILVENTLHALYKIAKFKRSLYNIPVIAVTGSVGKTSTKDIIASVIGKKYKTLKTQGNNNNNIGMPFTILKLKDEEAMVLEMGMNHLKEISLLSDIAKPTICVISNIGTAHIGNLGSRENILKAKLEVLDGMEKGTLIINEDNDLLHNYSTNCGKLNKNIKILGFGISNSSNINAEQIELKEENSTFKCEIYGKQEKVIVPVTGEHFVLNSLAGILVGEELDVKAQDIVSAIKEFSLTEKRMQIHNLKCGVKIINDAYNASFESMKASLEILGNYGSSRKIAILGDMFELGEFADEIHKNVGKIVANKKIDILICTGLKSKYIIESAQKSKTQCIYLNSKEDIIEKIAEIKKKGDVILVKASNGMKFYEIAEELKRSLI